ncbi:MAG: helix-turn-helix domain-containing protein, partial [Christensenellales bacterium]
MKDMIYKLRTTAKMSQEQFAEIFKVSRQSVQKWERGTTTPELSKLIEISKYFGISLDSLVLSIDKRTAEEMRYNKVMKPRYSVMDGWEFYPNDILTEYEQSVDEGLNIEKYKDLFVAVSKLPNDEIKKKLGDVLFEIVNNAETTEGYKYKEPSDLAAIKTLRREYKIGSEANTEKTESKIYG